MSRYSITVIRAFRSDADPKPRDLESRYAWVMRNHRTFQLRGYWDPEKAIAYARKRGCTAEEIRHEETAVSGKPKMAYVYKRYAVINGAPVAVDA